MLGFIKSVFTGHRGSSHQNEKFGSTSKNAFDILDYVSEDDI